MVTRTPDVVMDDPKIAKLLNDLGDDCMKIMAEAGKVKKTATFKSLNSDIRTRFSRFEDAILITTEKTEAERDRCLNGSAKDLSKIKTLLSKQLAARDDMKEMNGRVKVLAHEQIDLKLAAVAALAIMLNGPSGELVRLEQRFNALYKKLNAATKACKDASLKTILAAGTGAIAVCVAPVSAGAIICTTVAKVGADIGGGAYIDGNTDNALTKTRVASTSASVVGKLIKDIPKSFGPLLVLTTTAVNLSSVFSSANEVVKVQKEIKLLLTDIKRIGPSAAKQLIQIDSLTGEAERALKAALSGVRSYRAGQAGYHKLPNLMK